MLKKRQIATLVAVVFLAAGLAACGSGTNVPSGAAGDNDKVQSARSDGNVAVSSEQADAGQEDALQAEHGESVPIDRFYFQTESGEKIGLGMSKEEIDALLGEATAFTHATGVEMYEYRNSQIYYRDGKAAHISTSNMQPEHLALVSEVHIGSGRSDIEAAYGVPSTESKPRSKLASVALSFVYENLSETAEKLASPEEASNEGKVFYLDMILRNDKAEMINVSDYMFASALK